MQTRFVIGWLIAAFLFTANGCTAILSIPLITVDIQEVNAVLKIKILPNPVQNRMEIQLENKAGVALTLQLHDISGRLMAEQSGKTETFSFDTSTLASGVYVLAVETSERRNVFKVVVTK